MKDSKFPKIVVLKEKMNRFTKNRFERICKRENSKFPKIVVLKEKMNRFTKNRFERICKRENKIS